MTRTVTRETTGTSTWARIAARPGPSPLWLVPLVGYLWAGVVGGWASLSHLTPLQIGVGGGVLVPIVWLASRWLVRRPTTPEAALARSWAGRVGGGYALTVAVWAVYARVVDVLKPLDATAFGVLAVAVLVLGLGHGHVRALLLEHDDQVAGTTAATANGATPDAAVAGVTAGLVVPTVTNPAATEWTQILEEGGLRSTRVTGWEETWSGLRITVELDPTRSDTINTVRTALPRITGSAARRWKVRGVAIPDGAVRVDPGSTAVDVVFTVRLRDVLADDVPAPAVRGPISVNDGVYVGLRETGEPIIEDVRDQHGVVAGGSRGGKSTYENAKISNLVRSVDALSWAAGVVKLADLAGPWLLPLSDGRATRPVLDFVAGQDWEDVARLLRVTWSVMMIRQSAPRGVYRRDRNKVIPMAEQPYIHVVLEEADQILKWPDPIELPNGQRMLPGQLVQLLGSKSLSARIGIDLLIQGSTEAEMGPYAGAIKRNFFRRVVFRTTDNAQGSWLLPAKSRYKTAELMNKSMIVASGDGDAVLGKAFYLNEDTEIPELAIQSQGIGPILEDYAQAKLIEMVGDDYSARWSRRHTEFWRQYFGSFPALEDATPDSARDLLQQWRGDAGTRGTSPGTGTRERTVLSPRPMSPRVEREGKQGRMVGAFFVPDLTGTSPAPQSPTTGTPGNTGGDSAGTTAGDIGAEMEATLRAIRDLPESAEPVLHEIPEPLRAVLRAIRNQYGTTPPEFLRSAELAALVGADATQLGQQLTALGVPAAKYAGDRGRRLADLRAVGAAYQRGEHPAAAAGDE